MRLEQHGSIDGAIGTVLAVTGAKVIGALNSGASSGQNPVGIGELVRIPTRQYPVYGVVHSLQNSRREAEKTSFEIHLIGELIGVPDEPRFARGVSSYPSLSTAISRATQDELSIIYRPPTAKSLDLGNIRGNSSVPARAIIDRMLGQHFAILGSTGSGKSCAVTVILRSLIESHPHAHIVLIDPHNEYLAAFNDFAIRFDPSNLELPYWLLTFEEIAEILASDRIGGSYAERAILREAIIRAKYMHSEGADEKVSITVDTPIPYRLSDLVKIIDDDMGALNKADGIAPYRHLLSRIETIRQDRRYQFLFRSLYLRDSMSEVLGDLLRVPGDGRPLSILDISGIPSEITDVVVSLLCRLVFEFGLWAHRETAPPLLLVCEEAHRYVPSDLSIGFEPSRRAIDRIAKEGRKYGISLCLVSQRPADLSASSLSQCGTVFALRMSNERDQEFVRKILPDGSDWLIRTLPALGTGEAMVIGEGVSVPMQVHFSKLSDDRQPASQTPPFSQAWSQPCDAEQLLSTTIHRWRHQQR